MAATAASRRAAVGSRTEQRGSSVQRSWCPALSERPRTPKWHQDRWSSGRLPDRSSTTEQASRSRALLPALCVTFSTHYLSRFGARKIPRAPRPSHDAQPQQRVQQNMATKAEDRYSVGSSRVQYVFPFFAAATAQRPETGARADPCAAGV